MPTYDQIKESLDKHVEGKEDYVYNLRQCRYVVGHKPSCLWGHVLADLGIPLDRLDDEYSNTPIGTVLALEFPSDTTASLRSAALASQHVQDGLGTLAAPRRSWGQARDEFVAEYARLESDAQ